MSLITYMPSSTVLTTSSQHHSIGILDSTHLDNSTASHSTLENGSQRLRKFHEWSLVPNEIEKVFRPVIAG